MLTNNLRNYIDAAFAGIWVETFEPDEAIKEIDTLCRDEKWNCAVWDIEQGLQHNGEVKQMDPLTVVQSLGSLSNGETPILLILRNFHRFLSSIEIVQAVERQISQGKSRRAFIVVLAPVVQVPAELEKLFVIVEHELPTSVQLKQIAKRSPGNCPTTPTPAECWKPPLE